MHPLHFPPDVSNFSCHRAPEDKIVTGLTEMIDKIATQMEVNYVQASAFEWSSE